MTSSSDDPQPRELSDAHERLGGGLQRFFAARGVSASVVDDLCQETWTAVWSAVRAGKYDPGRGAMSTFVYAVAMNIWLRYRRKTASVRTVTSPAESLAERLMGESDDPAAAVPLAQLLAAVRRCAASEELTDDDRDVLRQVGLGASDRAIAAHLGVAPSTAHARKASALERLRGLLARLGYRTLTDSAERSAAGGEQPSRPPGGPRYADR